MWTSADRAAEATGNINCCFICRWNVFCDLYTIDGEEANICEQGEREKYNKSRETFNKRFVLQSRAAEGAQLQS